MSICSRCVLRAECKETCPAMDELINIAKMQDRQDKTMYIRGLVKKLGIRDAERSDSLRRLGEKVVKHFQQFSFIRECDISIGYVLSRKKKSGEKITYADCRKVPEVYRAYLPYDFVITFYEQNVAFLNDNQKKILMYHELQHIGIGPHGLKIIPHDIEDFSNILRKYSLDWNEPGREPPDILEVIVRE